MNRKFIIGLFVGMVAPIVGMAAYYAVQFRLFSLKEFLEILNYQRSLISAIVSVSLILNAALITFLSSRKNDTLIKGLFVSTCIYAVVAIYFKFSS